MVKEELLEYVSARPDNFSIQLKRLHRTLYSEIDQQYDFPTFGQKLYHHIYGNDIGKCEVCGKTCKFDGFHKGYRKRCSYKCMNGLKRVPLIRKTCPICQTEFETDNRHDRITCSYDCQMKYVALPEIKQKTKRATSAALMEKYGVDHPSKLPTHGTAMRKTKLERYGDETYVNPEQAKLTKLERYGDTNYNNADKREETIMEKYGVINPSQIEGVPEKANATRFEHFGEQMTSDNALEKTKQLISDGTIGYYSDSYNSTMLEKYGTIHAAQSPEILQKMIDTQLDNFYDQLQNGNRLGDAVTINFPREDYRGTRGPNDERIFYPIKCVACNKEFSAIIEDGKTPSCPICFPPTGRSKPENEVADFVKTLLPTTEIMRSDRTLIAPLELDIYIPDKKFAIEFDGIIWHSETVGKKHRDYHINKTLECEKVGVRLMHIFEHEWINKKEIVKRKIALALGMPYKVAVAESILFESVSSLPDKIYARKCEIREIESKMSREFLNAWHIQGQDNASIKFGAFYAGKLVATMSFGKKRVAMGVKVRGEGEYEMYRFCVADTPVIGIASRLLSTFIKKYNPNEILTFADIRYSGTSAFYDTIGFTRIAVTKPNYFYFHKDSPMELRHRFNFRKDVLPTKLEKFDATMTEYQNMLANGYDRIWDCGNLKYTWKKPVAQ